MGIVDDLIEAREAYERREWLVAYQALSDLDAADLRAQDFTALATTAYLLGRRNDCVQALQRAFQANLDADDEPAAARSALLLALVLVTGGEPAVGGGWAARAERILDGLDHDVVEHGYAMIHETFQRLFAGDVPGALETASTIAEFGYRYHDPDLIAQGLNMRGRLMTLDGRVQEGLRLMDESMVGVVAGEVSPIISGLVYCTMVEGCIWVCDYGRAGEWTQALSRWCDSQPGLVAFTGQCAVHRGQLMRLHGSYVDALDEFARAAQRYALSGGHPAVGLAHQERGDVLRTIGDYHGAERAYDEAAEHGNRAQPGRALLWLARGHTDAAATAIATTLDETAAPAERNRLLPAAVEILIAARRLDEASRSGDELAAIAESFRCPALRAAAAHAAASIALARRDAAGAAVEIRPAIEQWTNLSAPYETARCRVVLGRALRLIGDEPTARAELTVAARAFEELGAEPDGRDVAKLLDSAGIPGGLSRREAEVLQLVAEGLTNGEIADRLFIADKTVARHLSNIFTKLGVGSRTAAAAFAFEHDLV